MSKAFFKHLYDKQRSLEAVPSNADIAAWALQVVRLMFPEQNHDKFDSQEHVEEHFFRLQSELHQMMDATKACRNCDNDKLSALFFESLPELYDVLNTDIQSIFNGDPAARSEFEVIRSYPGFYAISFYRIAHALHLLSVPLIPRILTEHAHSTTGIDIHPGAIIGDWFTIDHGTGVVIGETSIIGRHVKLYQGVTLGALHVHKDMAFIKRHPTVEDGVIIYSGATILGGDTVIGRDSIIGGNVWITKSVPPGSKVYHKGEISVLMLDPNQSSSWP